MMSSRFNREAAYWGDFRREWPVLLAALLCFIGIIVCQPKVVHIISKSSLEEESGETNLGGLVRLLLSLLVGGLVVGGLAGWWVGL